MSKSITAIVKTPSKVVPLATTDTRPLSKEEKLLYNLLDKGEFISSKLLGFYKKDSITFVKKKFAEKPNLPKKEAALEILKQMPDNIPSTAFSQLLEAGMKEWMALKGSE